MFVFMINSGPPPFNIIIRCATIYHISLDDTEAQSSENKLAKVLGKKKFIAINNDIV